MAEQIGTYYLADNPDLFEPQRSNNFEFVVTGISSLLRAGVQEEVADERRDYITNGQEVVRLSVVKCPFPGFTQDTVSIKRGNSTVNFAGTPSFDAGTLVVNDFIGADSKSVLLAWQRLSYDVTTEKVGRASSYKKDCTLIEYSPDYEMVRYWELKGCWVKSVTQDDFDAEDGSKKTISAQIVYDRAIPHLPDEQ